MKTRIKYTHLCSLVVALCTASTLPAFSIVNQWNFDEDNGTLLSNTSGGGGTSFGTNIAGSTNGSGQFLLGGANYTNTGVSSFANLNPAAAISSGQLIMDISFTSWSLTASDPRYFFNLLNADDQIVAGIIIDVGSNAVFFGGVSDTGFDIPSNLDLSAPRNNSTAPVPYTFRLTLDYDSFDYTLSASIGGDPFTNIATRSFDDPNFVDPFSVVELELFARFNGTGTNMAIDSITISVVPEPSTYAALLGLGALAVVLVRRKRRSA